MTAKARVVDQNTTTTAFSYDALDRTESIGNTAFAYDCDGNRIAKNTTETVWNNGEVSADLIGDTVKVFTEDNSVYCENGEFTFNAIDSKGDVVATTSSYFGDYTYDAWGNDLYNTNTTNPIGYRGYYFDSETGLYYLKARYYDSTTGQFTQEDTVQDDNLQYNLYGYCSGNPVLYTDPTGHDAILLLDKDAVKGLGHTALMLQKSKKVWYYCSIDGKGDSKKKNPVTFKKIKEKFNKNSSISKLAKMINTKRYTEKLYFKGDFKNSITYFNENYYKSKKYKYNKSTNNCTQISFRTLTKGKFSKYNKDYQDVVKKLSKVKVPVSSFYAMKQFNKYIGKYKKAGFWERVGMFLSGQNPYVAVHQLI